MITTEDNILDVTLLEPKQKHPAIFERFDQLEVGGTLTILNDHDPKPLYYQLLGERGNIFTWEYLEEGPEWWKVNISKRHITEGEETIGEIAAKDLRKAEVFKKYGLDFCCGGKKTLKEACNEKGIDAAVIEKELMQADTIKISRPLPYDEWSLDFLADYIIQTHHSYIRKTLPDIRYYADKVYKVHGSVHPELKHVQQLVEEIHAELTSHMMKEERILFPYIKKLAATDGSEYFVEQKSFGTVQNPINMMELEHELVGHNMQELRKQTKDYTLPDDACASYSLLYRMLKEFEDDLFIHIHLENNILFPKAVALETSLHKNER